MFQKKNFAKGELSAQLSIGGTSLVLETDQGALFPATGSSNIFKGVIWGSTFATPFDDTSREVVEAYRSSGDTFTIVRAEEGTTAKQWEIGDNFMLTATAEVLQELETTKATGTTVNTGTADDEFVTPKGLADSNYQKITVSATEPASPVEGDLWVDIS